MNRGNGQPAVKIEVPPLQAAQRIVVQIEYTDGRTERIEATAPLNMQPGVLMVPTKDGHIGFPLEAIRRWEAVASPISLGRAQ